MADSLFRSVFPPYAGLGAGAEITVWPREGIEQDVDGQSSRGVFHGGLQMVKKVRIGLEKVARVFEPAMQELIVMSGAITWNMTVENVGKNECGWAVSCAQCDVRSVCVQPKK